MTARERVLASINHKEPDRIPIDLGATPSSGISAVGHARLMEHLGWDSPTQIYDVVQQLAQPGDRLINRLGVDVLDIGRQFNDKPEDWQEIRISGNFKAYNPSWFIPVQNEKGEWISYHSDGTPIAIMPGSSTFYDQLYFPWKDGYPEGRKAMDEDLDEAMDKVLWARLAHSPWDHAGEDGFWKQLRSRTKRLREESDKALLVVCGCNSVGDLVGIMALGGNYFFYNIHNIMPTQEDLP